MDDSWQRDTVQARFKELLESVPDAIVMVNAEGTIVLCNRQAERLFGYVSGELPGASIECLLPPEPAARLSTIVRSWRCRPSR